MSAGVIVAIVGGALWATLSVLWRPGRKWPRLVLLIVVLVISECA
jgi:hypothetical protein